MTDHDCKEQPLESDLKLSPSESNFVLRLLDVAQQSRVSLISEPEPEPEARPNDKTSPISSSSIPQSSNAGAHPISPKKRFQLPQIKSGDCGPLGEINEYQELRSSTDEDTFIAESAKLISELYQILGQLLPPPSPSCHPAWLNKKSPGTPPTPSIYRSISSETSSSFCDPPIADYPDYSPTSERTITARPSSARSYQELIGRYPSDWSYDCTRLNLRDYPENWPLREATGRTFPRSHTDIQISHTDKCTPSSSDCIPLSKSCPTSPFTESRPRRRQTLTKVKDRLSKIFGDRAANL
ncbi:uncharacterized protein N7483_008507 [Penicillium malachiteum]|uniref:uncharacterized protein n=1 Tax=Penicillium malachiteum TaxID=1324776 RepID=UPI002548BEF7|nr:uncharacterized protein N7483_008507 [Penicillium malachiteum]KAJ5720573.1 hypothetical protein N7483_008507 [Penicillium malachiteum]